MCGGGGVRRRLLIFLIQTLLRQSSTRSHRGQPLRAVKDVKHLTHAAQNQGYESHVFQVFHFIPALSSHHMSHFPSFTSYVNSLEMDLLFSHFHCCWYKIFHMNVYQIFTTFFLSVYLLVVQRDFYLNLSFHYHTKYWFCLFSICSSSSKVLFLTSFSRLPVFIL